MSPNPFVRCLFTLICLGYCLTPRAHAQIPAYDPVQDATYSPLKSYHGADIDSVDLDTGTLAVKVPILSYPQRGGVLRLDFTMVGTQPGAVLQKNTIPFQNGNQIWVTCTVLPGGCIHSQPNPNPSLIFNGFPCVAASSVLSGSLYVYWASILDFDGSSRVIGWMNQNQGRSLDGSGYLVNGAPAAGGCGIATSGSITDSKGVQVSYNSGNSTFTETDPNGNQITYLTTNGTVTDTMGRQIPAIGTNNSWNVPGINGGTEIFQASHPSQNVYLWTLPNSTSYSFQYTTVSLPLLKGQTTAQQIALLTQVTLPTGGNISWTYSATPVQSPCVGGNYYFQVLNRSVNANDGTGAHTWTYSYSLSSTASGVTTVTDPLGDKTIYTYGLTSCKPYPTQIQNYDNNGNVLQTSTRTYSYVTTQTVSPPALNVNLTSQVTAWPNGQQSSTSYSYDRDNGHSYQFYTTLEYRQDGSFFGFAGNGSAPAGYTGTPWTITKSDWGNGAPGAPLQKTSTTFSGFSGPNATSYLANNILEKPYTVQVLNGSNAQVALTQYNYDESPLASSGLSPSNQWTSTPPAGTYRGNNTSILRWLNSGTLTCQNGHTAGTGSNVTSKITYFDTGTIQTSADPCGNTTTFAYSNTYWGAYPTTVTNPLSQVTTHAFDFNTGLVTSTTDPNSLITSYAYDSMWRIASVTRPDGGGDTFTHQESSFPFTSTRNTKLNSSITKSETDGFDGLGRVTQHQLTSDPQGTDFTDTTYDALGRVATVSNPHRTCGTDPTSSCGVTTYGYDSLSRKISESYPDGSVLKTAYCGASTLVTDPTKRWRRSRTDGLGRLVEVDEPNAIGAAVASNGCPGTGEAIWVTNYTIDTLGNLTNVLQNGSHARTFSYDSLSRLLSSTNPEVGTITYAYNPDGPVLTKTDARGIITCYGTWSGISCAGQGYDALHRELTRTYSDGTPTVTTTYDQTACLGLSSCQNIGHRTSMTDAAGSESWAYGLNKTQFPDWPNILVDKRTTSGITKTGTYYSDLVGNTTSFYYPTGHVLYDYIEGANRIGEVYDTHGAWAFSTYPFVPGCTLFNHVCYTPQGTVYNVALDETSSFAGVSVTESYNSRLQPQEIKATSTGGNAMDISYNYTDPINGGNAGHVFGITNNLDTTRSQTFTYDQLNRITAAQTTSSFATSPGHCWAETYQFDNSSSGGAWGNLTQITQPTSYAGCTYEIGFSKTADANNHLSGLTYDASGNTTADGYNSYTTWNAESQLTVVGSSTYLYDGDGRRVAKANTAVPPAPYKLYWYGPHGEILGETDASGNTLNEYVFLGSRRIAMLPAGANAILYVEDKLGTSRVNTDNTGVVCYDADFYPYGGERVPYTDTCTQNSYKFEGKERDAESGNDDFGARYYSNRFGRWLSADWSNVPVAVPYANLSNPQTLNLYSMVADDPESFADLNGHYICHGTKAQCDAIADGLAKARAALQGQNLTKEQRAALNKVVSTFGNAGDEHDGVTISIGKTQSAKSTADADSYKDQNGLLRTDITFNSKVFEGLNTTEIGGIIVHERSHGIDGIERGNKNPQNKKQEFRTEMRAYNIESYVPKGLGVSYGDLWNPNWAPDSAEASRFTGALRGAIASTSDWCSGGAPGC